MPVVGRIAREICALYGCQIPPEVEIGKRLHLPHRGHGVMLHSHVTIGDDVTIYHGVTIGRSGFGGTHVFVGDRAVLAAGAVILFNERSDRRIGEGAVVGANSVVTQDIPPWEIWAGSPARKIGDRDPLALSPW